MDKIRMILFIILCIGARLKLVHISKKLSKNNLKLSAIPAIILGLSFMIFYLFDLRKKGIEAPNHIIWWNSLRPIHGSLYILYAIYAIKGVKNAYIVLLIDVIIGLIAWVNKYFISF